MCNTFSWLWKEVIDVVVAVVVIISLYLLQHEHYNQKGIELRKHNRVIIIIINNSSNNNNNNVWVCMQ